MGAGKNVRRPLHWLGNKSDQGGHINRGKLAMTKWLGRISITICLVCVNVYFQAPSYAATLDDMSYSSLPGDRVQIQLKLSEPVQGDPLNFTIDNPARIVVDFPNTSLNVAEKNQAIGIGAAHSASIVET